ncbi:hypothetical protein J1N35_011018 [Gossypium stocksii]|uniref:Reverse transcriptase zinc-binding domain-containing protein n=1 Tax=Gossypium stocksii TaxID=47602 RepID=A0A9D4AD09_9ROSI|nr:hypothetical protein J1N35_011018 [Gossypium stocksii]
MEAFALKMIEPIAGVQQCVREDKNEKLNAEFTTKDVLETVKSIVPLKASGIHWCQWKAICRSKAQGELAFRNLAKFNIALLAKQGWRILMNLNSLLAKVIKAKYFPNGDFMTTNVGSYPPFTWRSIWRARKLLEQGCGWANRGGTGVNIWNNALLPVSGQGRVQVQRISTEYTTVSDLINEEENAWKEDVICELFEEDDARKILTIPLSYCVQDDRWVWRGDNSGVYTTKNGYKWLMTDATDTSNRERTLQITTLKTYYTKVWNLEIAAKIKITLWRITNNYMPTLQVLQNRKFAVTNHCPVCGAGEETVEHVFRDCSFTRQVLQDPGVAFKTDNNNQEWRMWLAVEFIKASINECKTIAMAFWAIYGLTEIRDIMKMLVRTVLVLYPTLRHISKKSSISEM